jgi:organic hydroperoxide reductase OsmC/OhrA
MSFIRKMAKKQGANMDDPKIRVKSNIYKYKVHIRLTDNGEGLIRSESREPIKLSSPVEFGGIQGLWTPEDLLVASVNSCLMTTFQFYTKKRGFTYKSYESFAEGTIELIDMRYEFTEIKIMPKIIVNSEEDIETTKKLLDISKKSCLISNSLRSRVIVEPEIKAVS